MKPGRYVWLLLFALFIGLVVVAIVSNFDEVRRALSPLLDWFLQLTRWNQIVVGVVTWIVLFILPLFFVGDRLLSEDSEGLGSSGWVLVLWPPYWPIAVIVVIFRTLRRLFADH